MSRKILGLDVRKDAVSAVLLQSKIRGVSIEAHACSSVSAPNGIKDGVSDCIGRLMQQADISGATCIAAYPSEKIIYRNIRVPFKEQKKIRQILPYELETTLPLPVEDLIIDFYVPGLNNPGDHTELLAAAAETSELKAFMETLAGFNLVPTVLTAGGFSTATQVAGTKGIPDVSVFLDAGINEGALFVIISGRVCYARSFSIQTESSAGASVIYNHILQTLIAVKEVLQMDISPGGVFVTGGGVQDGSLPSDLARKLEIPVMVTNLVKGSEVTVKNLATDDWNPLRMDNALAPALNELDGTPVLNFRKGPFTPRKHWVEHKTYFFRTGILTAVILLFALMDIVIDNYFMEKKLDGLNSRITRTFKATFPDIQKIVDPLQQMRVELQNAKKQTVSPDSPQKNIRNIDILYDISTLIPDDVNIELNRIVMGPGSVQISGYTDTFNSVNNFQRTLQSGKFFKTVTINSANIEKTENRVNFNLNLQL